MPVDLRCPHCGTPTVGPDGVVGTRVRCAACGDAFTADHLTTAYIGPPAPPPLGPGSRVGRYRIVRPLGAGGMGAVYLADDTELGRQVALKVPSVAADGADRDRRFRREAQAAAALDHPHVCPVFDFGADSGRLFIAMKYVAGRPLTADLGSPWPLADAAGLVRTLARALRHAHERQVVHRDLKPGNIILSSVPGPSSLVPNPPAPGSGQGPGTKDQGLFPVVTDFGLALVLTEEVRLTDPGRVCGTAAYMAPEQARGDADVGPPADVYALGVMLFELAAGRLPHAGTAVQIIARRLSDPVPRLRAARPDADPWLDAICSRAMAKEPADRFPDMAALAAALDDYLSGDLIVEAGGGTGYAKIADAVAATAAGGVIRVRPGRYREAVALAADLTLVADGEVVIDGPVHITAGRPTIRNLAIGGLVIENPRTAPTITACEFHGTGVVVRQRAAGTFTRCRASAGVVVESDANPTFLDCEVAGHAGDGLSVRGGRGTFDRCTFTGHKAAGVAIRDRGDPTLTDCEVRGNRGPGVTVTHHGRGRFDRCRVTANGRSGVVTEEDGDPAFRDCVIADGKGDGVFVQARGRGTFERCEIRGNKRSGVAVQDDGGPTVVDCVIGGNGYQGVSVYVGGRGTFAGNDLRGNAGGPWAADPESDVVSRGNRE